MAFEKKTAGMGWCLVLLLRPARRIVGVTSWHSRLEAYPVLLPCMTFSEEVVSQGRTMEFRSSRFESSHFEEGVQGILTRRRCIGGQWNRSSAV